MQIESQLELQEKAPSLFIPFCLLISINANSANNLSGLVVVVPELQEN